MMRERRHSDWAKNVTLEDETVDIRVVPDRFGGRIFEKK